MKEDRQSTLTSVGAAESRSWPLKQLSKSSPRYDANHVASSLETAELTPQGFHDVGKRPGSRLGEYIQWLTIKDQKQAVLDDVARIRAHLLIPKSILVYGYVYDVKSGKLIEVEGAKAAGAVG